MKKVLCAVMAGLAVLVAGPGYAATTTLEPVVVTATRTPRPISQVAASITVITADEIAATGATRLDEVLRDTVGLQVRSHGSAGALANPSIRGSAAAQVLVLLDGVRLNSAQNGQFSLSDLPVALGEIERIEVLRGPSAALYGSNALGGVIQIITHTPETEPLTRLSWREGRFESRNLSVSTSQKLDRFRYRLGANLDRSDGFRENSDLEQHSFDGLLGFDLGAGYDLKVLANHLDKEIGVPGSTSFPSPQARQWDRNTHASLSLTGPVGPLDMVARGIYGRQRSEYKDPAGWFPSHDIHILKTLGAELQAAAQNGPHSLLFGGDVYRDEIDSTTNGKKDQDRWSAFGQYEIKATPWVTLLLGLRYDAHADFDNETSPRAAALFSLSESTRVRVSAAKAFRAPTLNDRFWPDVGYAIGNPDLVPETAWEYELALDQRLNEMGDISLALFLRDAEDLIEWAQNGSGVWTPSNVSEARIWGFEAGTNLRLHPLFATGANYTYLHPKNEKSDEFLDGKPRHQAHLYLDVGPVEGARLRLDGRYMYYYPETSREDKEHFVMDASLTRPFMLKKGLELEVEVSVKNLFDEEYEESPGYPMPPRQLFVGITAYF